MERTLSPEHNESIRRTIAHVMDRPLDQITPDAKFVEDLGADSLTRIELILALEESLNITIPDEAAERCSTAGELYGEIASLLPAESGK